MSHNRQRSVSQIKIILLFWFPEKNQQQTDVEWADGFIFWNPHAGNSMILLIFLYKLSPKKQLVCQMYFENVLSY